MTQLLKCKWFETEKEIDIYIYREQQPYSVKYYIQWIECINKSFKMRIRDPSHIIIMSCKYIFGKHMVSSVIKDLRMKNDGELLQPMISVL